MIELKLIQKNFVKDKIDLSQYFNAEILLLWECKNINYEYIIKSLPNLKKIRSSDWGPKDLTLLENLINLEVLDLSGIENDISLKGIEHLKNLTSLTIATPPHWDFTKHPKITITDLQMLEKLKNLIKIDFSGISLSEEEINYLIKLNIPNIRTSGKHGVLIQNNIKIERKIPEIVYLKK